MFLQQCVRRRVREEAGFAAQHALQQIPGLAGVALERLEIVRRRRHGPGSQAALNGCQKPRTAVGADVGAGIHVDLGGDGLDGVRIAAGARLAAAEFENFLAEVVQTQDAVDDAGLDGAARHAGEFRLLRILHQRPAAARPEAAQSPNTVTSAAREQDTQSVAVV